jgi:hypothetical protein
MIAYVTEVETATPDATGHVRGSLLLSCVGCGRVTAPKVWNWPDYQFGELGLRGMPEVPVYCPSCAEQQFDRARPAHGSGLRTNMPGQWGPNRKLRYRRH